MPLEYFRELIRRGHLSMDDLNAAPLEECAGEYPELFDELSVAELQDNLDQFELNARSDSSDRRYWTVAEAINQLHALDWVSTIKNEISRHCAAHFDQGQTLWPNPWQHLPLYTAWRETAQIDKRMEKLGVGGFRQFVAGIPGSQLP